MTPLLKRFRPAFEPLVAVVFLVLWLIAEAGRIDGLRFVSALVLYTVAIALARGVPVVALVIVAALPLLQLASGVELLGSTGWPVVGAAVFVGFVVARHAQPRIRWAGLAAGLVGAVGEGFTLVYRGGWLSWTGQSLGGGGGYLDPDALEPSGLQHAAVLSAIGAALFIAAWAAGFAMRAAETKREQGAVLDETAAQLTVAGYELQSANERAQIAQEVHDVLAHSLAVVVAVADGSRFLRETKPETTDRALREIADTARSALVDLRGLIESLTDDSGERPQPGLADLAALAERLGAAGMAVTVTRFGRERDLTPARQLTVYRIVQESLTNALKHGGEHPQATVSLDWQGPGLALTITSTGAGTGTGAPAVSRDRTFGIRGMKDRARLAGGWLTALRVDDRAFTVTAFIPSAAAAAGSAGSDGSAEAAA